MLSLSDFFLSLLFQLSWQGIIDQYKANIKMFPAWVVIGWRSPSMLRWEAKDLLIGGWGPQNEWFNVRLLHSLLVALLCIPLSSPPPTLLVNAYNHWLDLRPKSCLFYSIGVLALHVCKCKLKKGFFFCHEYYKNKFHYMFQVHSKFKI